MKGTKIEGVMILESTNFVDLRGSVYVGYNCDEHAFLSDHQQFVQDNLSWSHRGVLRGLHYQHKHPQGKFVRCLVGRIFDVVVDLRVTSGTFGCWEGYELSRSNGRALWVPRGCAHGFLALDESNLVLYKVDAPWAPQDQYSLNWEDRTLKIDWSTWMDSRPILSEKDSGGISFEECPKFP